MTPLLYQWDGDAMVPHKRFLPTANRDFVVGQNYRLEVVQERSAESHRHYFACINEAWKNIPEIHGNRWLTPDHLRKWALVEAGYFDETTFICHSKAEAIRLAGFLGQIDNQAVVVVAGKLVARRVAKSQSYQAMSKKEFQASKDGVLEVLAKLVGVTSEQLSTESRRSA